MHVRAHTVRKCARACLDILIQSNQNKSIQINSNQMKQNEIKYNYIELNHIKLDFVHTPSIFRAPAPQGCSKNQNVGFKISTLVFPSTWHVRSHHKKFQPFRQTRTTSTGYPIFNTFKFTFSAPFVIVVVVVPATENSYIVLSQSGQ